MGLVCTNLFFFLKQTPDKQGLVESRHNLQVVDIEHVAFGGDPEMPVDSKYSLAPFIRFRQQPSLERAAVLQLGRPRFLELQLPETLVGTIHG